MGINNYNHLNYVLFNYSTLTIGQAVDIKRILFEIENIIGLFNFNLSTKIRIEKIFKKLEELEEQNVDYVFLQFSLLELIDRKIKYYYDYYDKISKASSEMIDEGNISEGFWLTSWPHEKVLQQEEFINSVNFCFENWKYESENLRNSINVLLLRPPFILPNKYYDSLTLNGIQINWE